METDASLEAYVCQAGEEACEPGHAFGPYVRDYYLIHFVASGQGVLEADGREYPVGAGQGFLILPSEKTYYHASVEDPWHYAWVGFRGTRAKELLQASGLGRGNRVFSAQDPEECWRTLDTLRRDARRLLLGQMASLGDLIRFMSLIASPCGSAAQSGGARQYCEKARWFMEGAYDRGVTVRQTADFVGLSRSQLYRVFMEEFGKSPQTILQGIRLSAAARLLTESTLTVEDIARQTGYGAPARLSAVFKETYGVSPGAYRKMRQAKQT